MIILCGPSASGKTEIAKLLIKNFEFKKFVTTTTREKRIGEVDDVDYHFISRNLFEQYIKENKFIEYVNYNNNYYGTYKNEISDDKVLIVEPEGLKTFIKLENKNIVTFFIDANDNVRNKRMIERGDKEVDIKKRLDNDGDIFNKDIKNICTFVIENNGEKTLEELTENIFSHYKNALKK